MKIDELFKARMNAFTERSLAQNAIQARNRDLKSKTSAREKVLNRIDILNKALAVELQEEVVSFKKVKQLKEALQKSKELVIELQLPIDIIQADLTKLTRGLDEIEAVITQLNQHLSTYGKVISLDQQRSQTQD